MSKPKYDPPTDTFPYRIRHRYVMLSVPRRIPIENQDALPEILPTGVRKSALRGKITDRVNDAAYPYTRQILTTKRLYKHRFDLSRLERMDRVIEAANATCYAKLANCVLDLKTDTTKDSKRRRGWTETDWKKHMDYISGLANPKPNFTVELTTRGQWKALELLLPRIHQISYLPEFKVYRRLSQEDWYRDPVKVPPAALKYVISDRVKKLAVARVVHTE